MVMTEQAKNRGLYVVGGCAVAIELLLCVLGCMQMMSGWLVLAGTLICAVIAVYAYQLHMSAKRVQSLSAKLAWEQEQGQFLRELLEQERKEAASRLEEERASSRREAVMMQQECEKRNETFFSQMSHELRLPVSVAVGYAELLRDGLVDDPEEQQEYLTKIAERLHFVNELISRHLSEVRDGEEDISTRLKKVPFDLVDFLQKGLVDFCALTQEREIDCQMVTLVPSIPVLADPVLLQHVFDNLVENAMKYMGRPGTVTFVLSCEGDEVVLTCRDDGLGMDSAQAAHIFDNGFRGANTRGQSGSGHGLHLAEIIVRAHGGTCKAESAPGNGMRIVLRLPICGENAA